MTGVSYPEKHVNEMRLHSDAKAGPSSSLTPAMHLVPASPLPTTYLTSLTPFQVSPGSCIPQSAEGRRQGSMPGFSGWYRLIVAPYLP